MNGFERRRQEKEEAILYAALELFKQYGFNKVSIVDIATKASVSQVSIYNFFKSKENLKKELLKKLWDNYYEAIMSIMGSDASIQDKFEKLFLTVVNYYRNHSANFMAESFRSQLEKGENTIESQFVLIEREIVTLLNEGKNEGIIKCNISIEAMLSYIEMFRFYLIYNPEAALNYDKKPDLLKEMIDLYLNALWV